MREIPSSNPNIKIKILDERGFGNAFHEYDIVSNDEDEKSFACINFQKGPLKEDDLNGCFQEDLIEICIDRLRCFQGGSFACRENKLALMKLEEALMWLNKRTTDRIKRGVEGKLEA
jgi:hypothetical protein